jgi:hypothetical protein
MNIKLFSKHSVCVISDNGNSTKTRQWYLEYSTDIHGWTKPGHEVPRATKCSTVSAQHLWALSAEFASGHPSGP